MLRVEGYVCDHKGLPVDPFEAVRDDSTLNLGFRARGWGPSKIALLCGFQGKINGDYRGP